VTASEAPGSAAAPVNVVVVTGSGRSGTSSVAGALKRLGFHIPQPEVEADDRNPLGYYEPLWIAEFHKTFLNSIPVRTIDTRPGAGDIAMGAVTPELEAELRSWLVEELAGHGPGDVVVVKETRAYWVMPLWARVVADAGARMTSLTMLRHPTQVVRSRDSAYLTGETDAFRRQRETTNVAAWMNSVFATERATRGNPRAFVPYYDLIGDWRTALTRACGQLGVGAGDLTGPHSIDDFIKPALNRSGDSWEGLKVPDWLVEMAEQAWAATNVLVTSPGDEQAMATLDELNGRYVDLYEASAAIAADEVAAQVLAVRQEFNKRLARRRREIKQLQAEIERLKG